MKGILEFTSLNARQKEIEIETTIQNKEVKGTFIIKFPSLMDKINIEARLTSLLAGADVNIMKTRIYNLAEAMCYLKEVIIKKPSWFDYANIDNEKYLDLLNFVYDNTNKDSSLYPIISLNLASAYIIVEDYEKCPEIINDAISYFLIRNKIPNPIFYFTRALYKRLKNMDYKEDYDKAVLIASLAKNYNLINKFEEAKSYYEKFNT